MTSEAAQRDDRLRWFAVIAWSLLIFASVPLAETIQKSVASTVGRNAFFIVTIFVTAVSTSVAIARARLANAMSTLRASLFLAVAVSFAVTVVTLSSVPEEAIHFVEYGLLAALAHRALSGRMRNAAVYPASFLLGAAVALVDEGLQWMTPARYWELRDVGMNLAAVSLVELAIALGFAPRDVRGRMDARSGRLLVRMTAVVAVLSALTMFNTPQRIAWYTAKWPSLSFLAHADSAMFEYGYYYDDPTTGAFKSRLPAAELEAADRHRGVEVGSILDRYAAPQEYADVLRMYSPVTDPFVHEVRVHLFRRDRYLERAAEYPDQSPDRRRCMTIAYSEHKILEKYFANTLSHSGFELSEDRLQAMQAQLLPAAEQARAIAASESAVSRNLVTVVTERTLLLLFGLLAVGLVAVDRRLTAAMKASC